MKILMVCLGNICRSPLAEGILKHKIELHHLDWMVDSAGIGHWHEGEKPDERAIFTANKHGIDITYQRARQFRKSDLKTFDKIYALDLSIHSQILTQVDSEEEKQKVELIMNELYPGKDITVRDPYSDNDLSGFDEVYKMLDKVCDTIIEKYGINKQEKV